MGDAIKDMLERHEIKLDPHQLARMFEEGLKTAGAPPYPDPSSTLSADQLRILAEGAFDLGVPDLGQRDPVLLGVLEYAAMRLSALTTREAADRLGLKTDSRVRQRLSERTLYGLKVEEEWRLPIFQFRENEGLVPNIERIFPALDRELAPITVLHWFTNPNPDLACADTRNEPVSPLTWLSLGLDPEEVVELAQLV